MTEPVFIAGDWGSSNLRLFLCCYNKSAQLDILASQQGPGCSKIESNFEQIFFDLAAGWISIAQCQCFCPGPFAPISAGIQYPI